MFSTVNLLFSAARQEKSYLVVCPQLFFMVSKCCCISIFFKVLYRSMCKEVFILCGILGEPAL